MKIKCFWGHTWTNWVVYSSQDNILYFQKRVCSVCGFTEVKYLVSYPRRYV